MPFEVFDHTADIGLRVTAPTVESLFAEAGHALMSLIIENPGDIALRQSRTIDLEADVLEELFVLWLRELVYEFETRHLLFAAFTIQLSHGSRRLRAECRGELADWKRHRPDTEVKGVTYHQLRVVETATGWEASVILDI